METTNTNFKNILKNEPKIFVRVTDGYNIIDLDKVVYVEAIDSYSKIVLTNGQFYLESKILLRFERQLSDKGFWRIHKSYLINTRHLIKVFKSSPASLMMSNGETLPISTRRKNELLEKIKLMVF